MAEDILEFTIAARRKDPIKFKVSGNDHVYTFNPPKTATMILDIYEDENQGLKAMMDWLGEGLSDEDEAHLEARLRDPEDDVDFPDLRDMIKSFIEKSATGRPTS
jgi:hypothetical protein